MNSNCSEMKERYEAIGSRMLATRRALLSRLPELEGFWNRWFLEHRLLLEAFATRKSVDDQWEARSAALLRSRTRMVSALSQGLTQNPLATQEERTSLQAMLREHDEGFAQLLEEIRSHLRAEIVRTTAARKAIVAYAKASGNPGDF